MAFANTNSVLIPIEKPLTAPTWSSKIDRWSQLDDTCYTFCEALHTWDYLNQLIKPDFIFLVLPQASNAADFDFISSGASSPAKFVFTLPNICASVLFQLIQFSGRSFCISKGRDSVQFAKQEAEHYLKAEKSSWVFVNSIHTDQTARSVEFFNYSKFSSLK